MDNLDRHLEEMHNIECGLQPDGSEWPEEYDGADIDPVYDRMVGK
jgi:hypothetical protein